MLKRFFFSPCPVLILIVLGCKEGDGPSCTPKEAGCACDADGHCEDGLVCDEGAWVHKYDGTYYLSYSTGTTHLIVYATSDSPMGPFTYKGLVLPNHNSGWTTHHSIVEFQGAWYLFYHDALCSGSVTQKRCVKIADLYYNADGTIRTVSL